MQSFGYPTRQVPHTADKGQFDNLAGGKMLFHRFKRGFIVLGPQMSHLICPPDRSFFFVGEKITIPPVVTVQEVNLILG